MKRFIGYVSAMVAGVVLTASCDINKPDVFDDTDAFVSFDKLTVSVEDGYTANNDGAYFRVPVSLASVVGIKGSVSFTVKDGTAKEGVDFELVTTSGAVTFDAEHRTNYIEFNVLHNKEVTGDLTFSIELVSAAPLAVGEENTCTVTVADIDHPFAALFGTYTMNGNIVADEMITQFEETEWKARIGKDAGDYSRVLITNLQGPADGFEQYLQFYGIIDNGMTTITVPYGQTCDVLGQFNVALYGLETDYTVDDNGDVAEEYLTTDNLVGDILKDSSGNVTEIKWSDDDAGFYVYALGAGWITVLEPVGITMTKD